MHFQNLAERPAIIGQMTQEQLFHSANRAELQKRTDAELIVITGNSFLQASADNTFPFHQDSSFRYLTGITEPETILVIDDLTEYLIMPERSVSQLAFEGELDTTEMTNTSGITEILGATEGWQRLSQRLKQLKRVATLEPPDAYIAHHEMFTNPSRARLVARLKEQEPTLEIEDVRKHITAMRMVKADYELKNIKQAVNATMKLFQAFEGLRKSATSEHELLAEAHKIATLQQMPHAYAPIIASGKNALTLHYVKNSAKLDKRGMLLLDIGLSYKGYAADITRTISYKPTKRQQQVFDAVQAVHDHALSLLKPGITMRQYEESVVEYMAVELQELGLIKDAEKQSVRKYYPHSTSHFLGLDVHDVGDYEQPLEPGMVLTVEPGIYIPEEGIGIRLEDDVAITKNGNKVLSDALPKMLHSL